jgi:hypothetical protein
MTRHNRRDTTDILDGLPVGAEKLSYSNLKRLAVTAQAIRDQLVANQEEGNQYLAITRLSEYAEDELRTDDGILGVDFTFMWDGSTGVIKIQPSRNHLFPTECIRADITQKLFEMDLGTRNQQWGKNIEHIGTGNYKGKQPDQCFHPPARFPIAGSRSHPWPTMVIESGITASLSKLQEDAKWWFHHSSGEVRIVLIVCVSLSTEKVRIEKWQLAPPETTGNRLTLDTDANATQEIVITPNKASSHLTLPFSTLYNRDPKGKETDITLSPEELVNCVNSVF